MDSKKEYLEESRETSSLDNAVVEKSKSDLENIITKNGYQNGRLFHSKDKATYTVLVDNEVISLHFDFNQRALYLCGRKISSSDAHEQLDRLLTEFTTELKKANQSMEFMISFGSAVSQIKDN